MGQAGLSEAKLRPAAPADLAACLAITEATYAEHRARLPWDFPEGAEATTVRWLKSSLGNAAGEPFHETIRVIVADLDGTVVGHVLLALCRWPRGEAEHDLHAVIGDLSLVPEHRGKGLGRRLLAAAKATLREIGATHIGAQVWEGNAASEQLFLAEGFHPAFRELHLRLAPPLAEPCPPPRLPPRALWRQRATEFLAFLGLVSLFLALFFLARSFLG